MIPANPRAIIEVGGRVYDSWRDKRLFAGMDVELTTDEASQASWRIFDPDFHFIDAWTSDDGVSSLTARVWLGFGPDLEETEPVFKGLLARVERGSATSTFRFYDIGFKMRLVKRTQYHRGLDDLSILARLARRNGLLFEGPDAADLAQAIKRDRHKSIMQDAQTDWEFAQERAEESGLVLYVRGDTLFAKEAAKTGAPVATLRFREDFVLLHDFSLVFRVPENREGRPAKVETRVRGRGGRRLAGKSKEHLRGTTQVELKRDLSTHTKRRADRRAEARKALQREHAFLLSVQLLSVYAGRRPDVRDTVEMLDVGELFNDLYLADRVLHQFAPGQLTTGLELYRDIKE